LSVLQAHKGLLEIQVRLVPLGRRVLLEVQERWVLRGTLVRRGLREVQVWLGLQDPLERKVLLEVQELLVLLEHKAPQGARVRLDPLERKGPLEPRASWDPPETLGIKAQLEALVWLVLLAVREWWALLVCRGLLEVPVSLAPRGRKERLEAQAP
jgi:hypothetical protein